MEPNAFAQLLETGKRPRTDDEEIALCERDPKRLRKLKQKHSMRDLRQAEKRMREQTLKDMEKTYDMLAELLLSTADQSVIEVEEPKLEGRSSKNKLLLKRMCVLAAKCKKMTEILHNKGV
ncbi:MAG: hypothetical protein CMP20_10495 [Rickettsiales bacterium]|nr:hypothetical protein [Rickettsiales bacterium]